MKKALGPIVLAAIAVAVDQLAKTKTRELLHHALPFGRPKPFRICKPREAPIKWIPAFAGMT